MKQYGDRMQQELSGPGGGPIVTQPVQTDYAALRAMLAARGKQGG